MLRAVRNLYIGSAGIRVSAFLIKKQYLTGECIQIKRRTGSYGKHSVNPQNIEADIRKKLLPMMFKKCKAIGGGMEQAKRIVETIVHITRVGLNGV
ncbi:type I restriction enzyme, R subunit [Erwinia amylovora Ea644]|uniref:hypothetical protein n=1 Tax=Erwinia amylovora TaxID=552 RepID=UPI0002CC059A|nr:hypothetical protein [Erwinia amylovora]CCP01835.1 type I restriction enzyme, R subunit [Erwinia amylovora Ea644]